MGVLSFKAADRIKFLLPTLSVMPLSAHWARKGFLLEPGDHELTGDTDTIFQPTQIIHL